MLCLFSKGIVISIINTKARAHAKVKILGYKNSTNLKLLTLPSLNLS